MRKGIYYLVTFSLMFLLLSSPGRSEEVKEVVEKTFRFSSEGTISLIADEGSIVIRTWDKDEVHLKMTKRAWGRTEREAQRFLDLIEIQIQEGLDRLVIREIDRRHDKNVDFFDLFDSDFWREKGWRSGMVDYELSVPRRAELKLQCDEGDVDVVGTQGDITIDVDEGNIDMSDISSIRLSIDVDEGDVKLSGVDAPANGLWYIETDEGNIHVDDGRLKEAEINTDEGKIVLRRIEIGRLWVSSDEGDLDVDIIPIEDGNYRIETDEGDIEITVPENADLNVYLETDEGRIGSDFDLSTRRREDGDRREGVLGKGKGKLKVYTDEGDIYFTKRLNKSRR